ncbi:MAG TPA: hypothetical protein VGR18_07430 [Rubrobacter sp.]|nr:hypothetical protein [Rubrobacter sp.]
MTRVNGRDDKPRDLPRVPEDEGIGMGFDDAKRKVEDDWTSSGTEDPAFFIKPPDGE